jgi:chemotaxis protein CheD
LDAPDDVIDIFLQPGDFYFGEEKTRIRTLLGSCVAITLWHPKLHIGGMCHYMLPRRPDRKLATPPVPDGRYAEDAIKMFLAEVRRAHTRTADYQVKLFGGGRMFLPGTNATHHPTISETNVEFGLAAIAQCGFRRIAQDLGGDSLRNVMLDLWSGNVWVRKPGPGLSRSGALG